MRELADDELAADGRPLEVARGRAWGRGTATVISTENDSDAARSPCDSWTPKERQLTVLNDGVERQCRPLLAAPAGGE